MDDKILNDIKKYLVADRALPPHVGKFHDIEFEKGKRAKRVIDAKNSSQDYYKTLEVQTQLLDHYENVDWYERRYQSDFTLYLDKK